MNTTLQTKHFSLKNFKIPPKLPFFLSKMTTRRQKRKAVEELVSVDQETPLSGNNWNENPVAGTSKSPQVGTENLEEIKSTLAFSENIRPSKYVKLPRDNSFALVNCAGKYLQTESAMCLCTRSEETVGHFYLACTLYSPIRPEILEAFVLLDGGKCNSFVDHISQSMN